MIWKIVPYYQDFQPRSHGHNVVFVSDSTAITGGGVLRRKRHYGPGVEVARFYQISVELAIARLQYCFELWKSVIMDQSVAIWKRVYSVLG